MVKHSNKKDISVNLITNMCVVRYSVVRDAGVHCHVTHAGHLTSGLIKPTDEGLAKTRIRFRYEYLWN